ncbi:MAG: hypothetical protein JXA98_07005 [Methanosarcinaceae archaeon]|nr:hypothetical protein [Methanosarcinaceae archaeon]
MVKSTHWMVHLPGEVYANDLWFFCPLNETEVRAYLRDWHDVKRLWNGTEVYVA